MFSTHANIARVAAVAAALVTIGSAPAATLAWNCDEPETLVGAFVGTPQITLDAQDPQFGVQSVNFDGIGMVSGIGDALCTTADEKYDPVANRCWGHHTLTGDRGDSITIEFESTRVTSVPELDENHVPTIIYIKIEATWKITSGTGRYRHARGTGTLYVDAWAKPTGPLTMAGIGNWAMWGEVQRLHPRPCGLRRCK